MLQPLHAGESRDAEVRMERIKVWAKRLFWAVLGNAVYGAIMSSTVMATLAAVAAKSFGFGPLWINRALGALVACVFIAFLAILFSYLRHGSSPSSQGLAVPFPKVRTVQEWSGYKLEQVTNRRFEVSELVMDGKSFVNCTFVQMRLFYDGTAPMAIVKCELDEDTVSHILTHSPALAQWTENLRSLGRLKEGTNFAMTPLEQLSPIELQAENLRRTGKP